jgi:hypothetical protein
MAALFGYMPTDWLECWFALFAFCIFFRLCAFVALVFVETNSSGGRGESLYFGAALRGIAGSITSAVSSIL